MLWSIVFNVKLHIQHESSLVSRRAGAFDTAPAELNGVMLSSIVHRLSATKNPRNKRPDLENQILTYRNRTKKTRTKYTNTKYIWTKYTRTEYRGQNKLDKIYPDKIYPDKKYTEQNIPDKMYSD